MSAQWRSEQGLQYELKGKFGKQLVKSAMEDTQNTERKSKAKKSKVQFEITERHQGSQDSVVRLFEGSIDALHTRIKGEWCFRNDRSSMNRFDLKLADKVHGTLTFNRVGMPPEVEEVSVDFNEKKIVSASGD